MSGGRLTKAQLEQALAETRQLLLAEREARNADVRRVNLQLTDVARQRDEYRSRVDSTGIATAINQARARQLEAEDRARAAEERAQACRDATEDSRRDATSVRAELRVCGLELQVAKLERDNEGLRHEKTTRELNGRLDHQAATIRDLRERAASPDLALTLENGQTLLVDHNTYEGRWVVDGFHLLQPDGAIRVTLKRVRS